MSLYYAYFHSRTVIDSIRGFVDIVKSSFVFIVSLFTCIGSTSRHVLYMKILYLQNTLLSHHRSLVKNVFILLLSASHIGLGFDKRGIRAVRPREFTKPCLVEPYI